MNATRQAKVLFVDDEPMVLSGVRRTLGSEYRVETASSAADALAMIEQSPADDPFAVIVSDMMMPVMNGAEFLRRAHLVAPDAVLLILSGQADLVSTVAAVNNSSLFRFLTKPCSPEELRRNVDDALRQYQLVTAERELLEQTLSGAVDSMMKVLAVSNPGSFGRATQVASLVESVAAGLGVGGWELRVAALLSQVGCVAVPDTILANVHFGADLSPEEQSIYASHPNVARELVASIPRLERVAEWIGTQPVTVPTEPAGADDEPGEQAILHAAIVFLAGRACGRSPARITAGLTGIYPRAILDALVSASGEQGSQGVAREVTVEELQLGMVLKQDVLTSGGMMLVRAEEVLDETLLARLRNFARSTGVVEPIRVLA